MIFNGWKEVSLSEVGKIITGKTPSTKVKKNFGLDYPFITPKDVQATKHIFQTERYLSQIGANTVKNCILPPNTVCVSCIGNIGYAGITIKNSVSNQQINSIIPSNEYDVNFLFYYIKHLYPYFKNLEHQSTTLSILNKTQFSNIKIIAPPLIEQKAIAKILSCLDDKIEINNHINNALEEMTKAIFKTWFVDFEFPNEGGQPYESGGGKMVDSELGLMPIGWQAIQLGYVTTNIRDKTKSNNFRVLSAVNTGNLILSEEYFTKQVFSKNLSKYIIVKKKEFAYNPARVNIGSIGMNEYDFDGCVSPVYVVFKAEEDYHWFFKLFIKTDNFKSEVLKRASGSVRQTMNYSDFALIKTVYPPRGVIDKFNQIFETCYLVQKELIKETEILSNIRNELLQKLMSGEIIVPVEVVV